MRRIHIDIQMEPAIYSVNNRYGKDWSAPIKCWGRIGLASTAVGSVGSIQRRLREQFTDISNCISLQHRSARTTPYFPLPKEFEGGLVCAWRATGKSFRNGLKKGFKKKFRLS